MTAVTYGRFSLSVKSGRRSKPTTESISCWALRCASGYTSIARMKLMIAVTSASNATGDWITSGSWVWAPRSENDVWEDLLLKTWSATSLIQIFWCSKSGRSWCCRKLSATKHSGRLPPSYLGAWAEERIHVWGPYLTIRRSVSWYGPSINCKSCSRISRATFLKPVPGIQSGTYWSLGQRFTRYFPGDAVLFAASKTSFDRRTRGSSHRCTGRP